MRLRHAVLALGMLIVPCIEQISLAQGPGAPPPMAAKQNPEQELKRIDKKLKLSDDQKAKLLPLLTERSSAMKALMEDQDTEMAEKLPRMMKLRDAGNARIRELLTESQRQTFDQMLADEMKRREQGPGDGSMGAPPDGAGPPPQNP